MKIIHLISGKQWEASQAMALDLMLYAQQQGHEVIAFAPKAAAMQRPILEAGIKVVSAPLGVTLDVISPTRLAKQLRHSPEGETVVHAHRLAHAVIASRARILAQRPDVKIILSRHIAAPGKNGITASSAYADTDAIILPSRYALERFLESTPEIDSTRLHIITSASAPPLLPNAIRVPVPGQKVLLAGGNLTPSKDLRTLVEAMARLKDLNLRLIITGQGVGTDVMPAIRTSRSLGVADRIDWRGARSTLSDAANEADIAIAPDTQSLMPGREIDLFLSHSLPVIASDIQPHRELADNSPLITTFRAGSAEELANAIRSVVVKNISRTSRVEAQERFTQFADKVISLYKCL